MSSFRSAISTARYAVAVSTATAAAVAASTIEQSPHFSAPAVAPDLARRRKGRGGHHRMSGLVAVVSLTMLVGGCASGTPVSSQANLTPSPPVSVPATTAAPSTTPLPSEASPSGTPAGSSVSAIGTALPSELIGTWNVLLGQSDVAAIASHVPGFDTPGVWRLTLAANTFQLFNPDDFSAGPVPAGIDPGKHLVVANDPQCPGEVAQTGGVYTYQVSAASLTISPVGADACPFREWLLRAKPWKKV